MNESYNEKLTVSEKITEQVGVVAILCSIALPVMMLVRRDRTILISLIYVLAFCGVFITSAFVDSYWLIPVFPYFVFFSIVLIVVLVEEVSNRNVRIRLKPERFRKIFTRSTTNCLVTGGTVEEILFPVRLDQGSRGPDRWIYREGEAQSPGSQGFVNLPGFG